MSILCSLTNGWIISHQDYIENVYKYTLSETLITYHKLCYCNELFKIVMPYKGEHNLQSGVNLDSRLLDSEVVEGLSPKHIIAESKSCRTSKKRKQKSCEGPSIHHESEFEEISLVKTAYLSLVESGKKCGHLMHRHTSGDKLTNNEDAREMARDLYVKSANYEKLNFNGANNTDTSLIATQGKERYVFPPHSTFYCYDVNKLDSTFLEHNSNMYDLILLDPPWWNKYIRRKRSMAAESAYEMMYDEDLCKLPISSLLAPGALVAVWCTNSPSHIDAVHNKIFQAWKVEYIGTWYWFKVTQSGDPVCPFTNPRGKQPFERIIFGYNRTENRQEPLPTDGKMILSVPSAIHSHKPPLTELLAPYLPTTPRCMELFARYLLPGWTSWGNEVLKLQHLSLFNIQPATTRHSVTDNHEPLSEDSSVEVG